MKERWISTEYILKTLNEWEMFEYMNNWVKKMWYYFEESNVFVWIWDKITTVIKPTKNYINNFKKQYENN